MYKTLVYTLVNGNILKLANRKQQKLQKFNAASRIFFRLPSDAMATKFGTKSAITRLA